MTFHPEDRTSIFGVLRPDHGQTVARAVVATYSLDLIAMLGLVLALGGDAEAEFDNSPLGLVQAFDRVRGRLVVLHQLGRVIAPRAHRSVLPLLDTMLRAIPADERVGSWHPKVALVRYEGPGAGRWRFWIGSRNLTGTADLEAGLLLVTAKERAARQVPDISRLASDLLAEAEFTSNEIAELREARWLAPPGLRVRALRWRRPGQTRRFIDAPLVTRGDRACAVSPFIDRTGLREVLKAGSIAAVLLTTDAAASDCAPMAGITFRTGTPPEPETTVSVEQQQEASVGEFLEPPPAGIHAKILCVPKGKTAALMLGSANLTRRGLVGPNAEAVAILDTAGPALADSLASLVVSGFEFQGDEPDAELVARERAARELDEQISRMLEARLALAYVPEGLLLLIGEEADAALAGARFQASPFLEPDAWTELRSGVRSVRLLESPSLVSEHTSLVTFRASSATDPRVSRGWVLSLPVEGMDEERRDRALLARYVGASRFRAWLRSLLDGVDGTAGQRWSDPPAHGGGWGGGMLAEMFTLETMLAAWARDPEAFERRVEGMTAMLESFREAFEALPDDEERRLALEDLAEVRPFLRAVHDAINGPS